MFKLGLSEAQRHYLLFMWCNVISAYAAIAPFSNSTLPDPRQQYDKTNKCYRNTSLLFCHLWNSILFSFSCWIPPHISLMLRLCWMELRTPNLRRPYTAITNLIGFPNEKTSFQFVLNARLKLEYSGVIVDVLHCQRQWHPFPQAIVVSSGVMHSIDYARLVVLQHESVLICFPAGGLILNGMQSMLLDGWLCMEARKLLFEETL